MPITRVTPILNVADVPASLQWFESLGWTRAFSWNKGGAISSAADRNEHGVADFAGICCGDVDVFVSQTAPEQRSAPIYMSWWMSSPDEVDELFNRAELLGYSIVRAPFDAPWGVREFHLQHADGHIMRIGAELPCA
jgi:uncharacterized glyoxalase superfamily protein PhnB